MLALNGLIRLADIMIIKLFCIVSEVELVFSKDEPKNKLHKIKVFDIFLIM